MQAPPDRTRGEIRSGNECWVWALVCSVILSIPFLVVRYAPLTDLPQQVAQIRLFGEVLEQPESPYRILWFSPNRLSYLVLGLCWAVFPPDAAGRMAMLAIGILWIGSIHYLAHRRQRPVESAILASLLFFNHIVYWGSYSFAIGWPAFVMWYLRLSGRRTEFRWAEGLMVAVVALLLYETHALWFAAGLLWLGIHHVAFQDRPCITLLRLACALPTVILAALWYPGLGQSGFTSETFLISTVWQRLVPSWLLESSLGGLRGGLEPVVFTLLVGWILLGVLGRCKNSRPVFDRELLVAGIFFALLALFLPYLYSGTIQFAERWLPIALILLVLACPASNLPLAFRRTVALVTIIVFSVLTALCWKEVETKELSGLREAIEALPPVPDVLGLDFLKSSTSLRVRRPFLQTFA